MLQRSMGPRGLLKKQGKRKLRLVRKACLCSALTSLCCRCWGRETRGGGHKCQQCLSIMTPSCAKTRSASHARLSEFVLVICAEGHLASLPSRNCSNLRASIAEPLLRPHTRKCSKSISAAPARLASAHWWLMMELVGAAPFRPAKVCFKNSLNSLRLTLPFPSVSTSWKTWLCLITSSSSVLCLWANMAKCRSAVATALSSAPSQRDNR
mmetsp:Transcript_49674/g.144433  ORF Transcript_49674/g.144433 Transcript_49674/m.144433 type:complete len:210 (-) Transcript_49674:689-1318(-)